MIIIILELKTISILLIHVLAFPYHVKESILHNKGPQMDYVLFNFNTSSKYLNQHLHKNIPPFYEVLILIPPFNHEYGN